MLRIVAVLHNPAGSTGLIGKFLSTHKDVDFRVLCPLAGDALPAADAFDAAIVFGGKMSANDCNSLPELFAELLWIRNVVENGKPFLGICLGAQLLAIPGRRPRRVPGGAGSPSSNAPGPRQRPARTGPGS
mgnify:CR=1 FL=1